MIAADFVRRLEGIHGDGPWRARCPAHDDKNPSLSVSSGDDQRILLHCHAGCSAEQIVAALGLTLSDLMPENGHRPRSEPAPDPSPAIHYDYNDAEGRPFLRKTRRTGKRFSWSHREGDSWIVCAGCDHERPLYRLRELLAADPSAIVYVVEGEKAADRLAGESKNAVVVTSGGAQSWRPDHAEQFPAGRDVVILQDNDKPGLQYAQTVAGALAGKSDSVRVVLLPGLPEKGDVFDYLEAGHTLKDVEQRAVTVPVWAEEHDRLIVSWDEFMAETYPSVPSLWGDALLVKGGGYTILAGDTGVGKTILKVNLILSLAEGRDEFLGFPLPGRPVRCLLLEAEGSRHKFRDRFRDIAAARGIRGSLPIFFHARNTELAIDGPNLERMITEARAEYTFLDAIGRFWTGEENGATEWRAGVTTPLAKVSSDLDEAFSFNDHPVKPNENRSGQHKIRGSAAKIQDAGAVMRLEVGRAGKSSRFLFFDRVRDGALPFPDRDPSRLPLEIDVKAGTVRLDEREDADLGNTVEPRLLNVQKIVGSVCQEMGADRAGTATVLLAMKTELDLERSRAKDLLAATVRTGLVESAGRGYYRLPGQLGADP